ncbi:LOW QUALITY PROTEIN: hypothetical protein ACHAXM_011522 [Skeletonema potamos]
MQYPYKQRSPPSASRQQFSSPIVDMDGFPAASFASTAPSNRKQNDNTNDAFLITRNDAKNVRKLEPASAIMVGDWGADSTVASSSIATSQNHDRIAAALYVATNRQPPQTRDQQIFRRPGVGTSLSRSFDSNNSRGRSNEQNIISEDNKPSPPNNNTVNSGITFQPYDVRHDNTPPRKSMAQSSTSRGNLLPQLATTNQTSKSKFQPSITASQTPSPSKSVTNNSTNSPQQSPTTTTTAALLRNRTGMVNKLKAGIEKKLTSLQQQNQSPLEIAKLKLKQTMGVQFNVPPSQQQQRQQQQQKISAQNNGDNTAAATTTDDDTDAYPTTLSPSRSNVQSDVTGYSGESSSYAAGWPGTVDKRGRAYVMEPSYSESEDESNSHHHHHNQRKGTVSNNGALYPSQQYRPENPSQMIFNDAVVSHNPSFDGGDSVAELEAWMSGGGDGDSVAFSVNQNDFGRVDQRRSGPIDLDEVYERRLDSNSRKDSGWREGRHEALEGISEAKTAADLYLESALGMSTATSTLRRQKNNPVRFPASDMGANSFIRQQGSKPSFTSPSPTKRLDNEEARRLGIDTSGSEKRVLAAGRRIIPDQPAYNEGVDFDNTNNAFLNQQYQSGPQPMTEEALRSLDSRNAPPRVGASMNFRGYAGFLDKCKDVPNLMDDESVASTSLDTAAYSVEGHRNASMGLVLPSITETPRITLRSPPPSSSFESGSDVFDGVQSSIRSMRQFASHQDDFFRRPGKSQNSFSHHSNGSTHKSFDEFPDDHFEPFSTQFNPFAAHRESGVTDGTRSGAEFVNPFSEEDYDSVPDLSIYCVDPDMVRKMVRAFRKICTSQMAINSSNDMLSEFESLVDTKKSFALFEMRSRIMETDIDRGLDRRGGTNVVDDIVLTPYFQAAHRVRDAVIVSKAWRDGATPKDVVTAHLLTRRSAKAYYVPRLIERIRRPDNPFHKKYWLEEVHWLDDTDFMMMRCQSLEAGTMKGFEMFTIGDCQSILLKMTSDNATVSTCLVSIFSSPALLFKCSRHLIQLLILQQLRRELKAAMMRQIQAEELMQAEIDLDGDENVVAEAEHLFRKATYEVKTLSMRLVLADKAFTLVRGRMEKLVKTIESLLVQMEDDHFSQEGSVSSVIPEDEGSDDDDSSRSRREDEEKQKLQDRAKRAELSAEVAVREALMAKQEAEKIKVEKQREIDLLKEKLARMESKSIVLANSDNHRLVAHSSYLDKLDAKSIIESSFDREPEGARAAAKSRLKQKFRKQLPNLG